MNRINKETGLPFTDQQIRAINFVKRDIQLTSKYKKLLSSVGGQYPSEADRLKHVQSLPDRIKTIQGMTPDEMEWFENKVGGKKVPNTESNKPKRKYTKKVVTAQKVSPKPKSPRISNMQYSSDTTPLSSTSRSPDIKQALIKTVINTGKTAKKYIHNESLPVKVAKSSIGRIASRVAGSGIVRAAGTAGLVMGAASDIMNISRASREIGRVVRYKGVEATPETIEGLRKEKIIQGALQEKAKEHGLVSVFPHKSRKDYYTVSKNIPSLKSQAEMNTAVGKRYGWGAKSSGTMSNPTYVNKPMVLTNKPSGVDTATKKQRSVAKPRVLQNKRSKKPTVSTPLPSIVPKRPEQIIQDMPFLNAPSFTSQRRVSPVRPIATRVQLPEQFMSPSMKLASLPKISRYRLGISR